MNVAIFIPFLTRGGAEKVVVDLANSLIKKGHLVTIFLCYPRNDNFLLECINDGVSILYILPEKNETLIAYIKSLIWFIRCNNELSKYDVVHCHLTFASVIGSAIWIYSKCVRNKKFPIVIETHHSVGTNTRTWQKLLFYFTSKMRDGYVLMAQVKKDNKYTRKRKKAPIIEFIPNGIDISYNSPTLSDKMQYAGQINLPNNKIIIGTIGRMVNERNPNSLINVFHRAVQLLSHQERDGIHILWGGDGYARDEIVRRLEEKKILNFFTIPGIVHNPKNAMALMDVYITMNVGIVTGISGLEAASLGVPVIAVQMLDDYVLSNDDWIWSSSKTDDVAAKLVELIRNTMHRTSLGERQKKYVFENLSSDAMTDKYIDFFKNAILKKTLT